MINPKAAMIIADKAAERLGVLFSQQSMADYIGEEVSILEHSWQAYEEAQKAGAPEVVQVASLFHDVGHMCGMEAGFPIAMDGCGMVNHEGIGGDFLKSLGFSADVAWLVANHVNAKRFLVWKDHGYPLSEASRITLGHQGGPMTNEEAKEFMAHPMHEEVIRMRYFDEAAKVKGLPMPSIDRIKAIAHAAVLKEQEENMMSIESNSAEMREAGERYLSASYRLTTEQLRFYNEFGYLVVPKMPLILDRYNLSELATQLSESPSEEMLLHREEVEVNGVKRVQVCRVENFCKTVPEWKEISALAQDICSELFNEPAILFKDKLNYKLPGGGGFLVHQDATAYKPEEFAATHISVMVVIDKAVSEDVGPLQVAKGRHNEGIFPNSKGVIEKQVEDAMEFEPLFVNSGDLVFFSSYLPHRSFANTSANPRRLAYLTYNKLSEGNFNETYYKAKLEVFHNGTGGSISINDDFAGKIVH